MAERRKRLFALLALLLGSMIAFFVLEVGLRLLTPDWLEQRMRELNVGEAFVTGSDQTWPVVREDGKLRQFVAGSQFMTRHYEYEHAATIDELGGRTTPRPATYEALLPVLGDSFTFGLGVADDETFVALSSHQVPHRLLNLGVPGSCLHDQLNILEMRHGDLGRPQRYLFVLFMGNDLHDIRRRHEATAAKRSGQPYPNEPSWLWHVNTYIVHHPWLKKLYTIQFVRQKVLLSRRGTGQMSPVFRGMLSEDYVTNSLVFLRRELERLTELSLRLDFDYQFLLLPDVHQLDASRRAGKARSIGLDAEQLDPERLRRAIRDTLHSFDITTTDLTECLARRMRGDLFYVQDDHFTAAGHVEAAGCLVESGFWAELSQAPDPA